MDTKTFTEKYYVDRKNTDCIKWDGANIGKKLPMFIADMDFKTEDKIIEGLNKRINHGAFGYSFLPEDYFDALNVWNKKRNKITFKKDSVRFSRGAVDAINQVLYALTKPKDAILITTPVYPPFAGSIKNTKRTLVTSSLIRKNGLFTFNYEDLEKKFKNRKVKMMVLCSPHNPLGRVWTKKELEELFKLTHKYHVLVLSDEVHSDIIMPNHKFIPSLSFKKYANEIIPITALSKTFSLAIFAHCHVIIPNKKLRDKFDKYQYDYHLASVNVFNAYPTYYGYKYGEEWLDSLNLVVYENYKCLCDKLGEYLEILPLEGTYLAFVNFKGYTKNAYDFLDKKCDIVSNPGETFAKGYETWARLNLATSLDNINKACDAILKQIKK